MSQNQGKLNKEIQELEIQKHLSQLTAYVRKKYGVTDALNFHIDYIQPIEEYFEIKKEENG